MDSKWKELKEYLEWQKVQSDADLKMYREDSLLPKKERAWVKGHAVMMACCIQNWSNADLTIKKMERLEKSN